MSRSTETTTSESRTAIVLSVGTELTEGSVLNTHFRYLGRELKLLGFRLIRCVQVPDQRDIFQEEIERSCKEAKLILITGGLGPTSDDLTREVVAAASGVELDFVETIWQRLKQRYEASDRRIAETNRKQAFIPRGFHTLENPYGTAPAFYGRMGTALVAALPGPPGELEPIFEEQLRPVLAREFGSGSGSGGELLATALMIPESRLEEALLKHRRPGVRWGTRIAGDRILVILAGGSAETREEVFQDLEEEFDRVRILKGDARPKILLLQALNQRGLKLALAESCTGGLAGKMVTDTPGSSEVFWGGIVVYSNEAKRELLRIDKAILARYGAVSRQMASAMSEGILRISEAGVGVAITGIAGPEGGSEKKPVGTVWISARTLRSRELCRRYRFSGNREQIRRRAAVTALLMAEAVVMGRSWPTTEWDWRVAMP